MSQMSSRVARSLCLALLTFGASAYAIPMPPGGVGVPPGQTAAGTPSLAGVIIEDEVVAFNCGGAFHGKLQYRVVRSHALGTLDFYYRVINDGSSTSRILDVRTLDFGQALNADADYRIDGLGTAQPSLIRRSGGLGQLVDFEFFNSPIDPGESSRFFYVRSGRRLFEPTGAVVITDTSSTCVVHETFRPI